jgi:hypothetical protein
MPNMEDGTRRLFLQGTEQALRDIPEMSVAVAPDLPINYFPRL